MIEFPSMALPHSLKLTSEALPFCVSASLIPSCLTYIMLLPFNHKPLCDETRQSW